ncbi:MAG: tetraacyldisaccharide 4'-kinase [Verrucomicrobia bacterium]|jgi:tetraacyldisaccharide 4'-kinase|nr:tetraacyldisaccharide 4'-kinase [Verrucomicrobiota bacterium]MBT7068981.1 tetraacyldisaccharide 4'-kinase [Verrucomicrobiota bacterium]MBT7702000.1 tetraacyldisaccharide 4'-kinase [Verrucomicrobiota bacterium]
MQEHIERAEEQLVKLIGREGADQGHGRRVRLLLRLLKELSRIYGLIVVVRLFLYQKGLLRPHTLGCQVISIGNLTVGGTGKTPVVEIFARELQKAGRRVAILSRGYKKAKAPLSTRLADRLLLRERQRPPRVVSDGSTLLLDSAMSGDEPYMLASNLSDVAVLVDKDRVKSGRYAINRLGCDTLVLDDGFQYMALKHRLDIVLVDRTNPFGNEQVLPRGILREPVRNISRASFIFITKSNGTGSEALRAQIREWNTTAEIIECRHAARYLTHVFSAERHELDYLKGRRIVAVSGIAMPAGFEQELARRGAEVVDTHRFADHHRYSQQEIIDIINAAKRKGVEAIVTTEKDAVRFPRLDRCDVPIFFLRVDIEILSGAEDFHECISRICFKSASHAA